jgi:hypothetical protein
MSRPKPQRHSDNGSYGNDDDHEYDIHDNGNDDDNNYDNDDIS